LTLSVEKSLTPAGRRAAIRLLYREVEKEIRAELLVAREDAEFKGERTFLWCPIPAICLRLEIGPGVLSRLLKELTGMSASQLVDKIKAEGLKEKLRANLREFVQQRWRPPGSASTEITKELHENLYTFWQRVKLRRRSAAFSYAGWAAELGFANYTRLYRACLLCYGMSPSQLEDQVLKEYAEFFALATDLKKRKDALDCPHDFQYDRYRAPYHDKWKEAWENRRDWVERMRGELGLVDGALVG